MQKIIRPLVLVIITVMLYSGTIHHGFVWDDGDFVGWSLTRSVRNIPLYFSGAYPWNHVGKYRPLKGVILTVDYRLWGTRPEGYHAQAIAIYVSGVIAVYLIASVLLKSKKFGFLTALIFAVHPVHVEAVTFVTSSTDVLGLVLALFSFYLYMLAERKREEAGNFRLLSLIVWIGGILLNEIALILPLLLLVYDFLFVKKWSVRLASEFTYPFWIVFTVYWIVRVFVLKIPQDEVFVNGSMFTTALLVCTGFLKYYQLLVVPWTLSIDHRLPGGILSFVEVDHNSELLSQVSIISPWVILSCVVTFLFIIMMLKVYRRHRLISFAFFWFFICLIPVSHIIPLPIIIAERFLFLPSFGYALLIGVIAQQLILNRKQWTIGVFLILGLMVAFYSYKTLERNSHWKDAKTFWSVLLEQAPESVLARHNLGNALRQEGDLDGAEREFEYAAVNNGKCLSRIHLNLGTLYEEIGEDVQALEEYSRAVACEPGLFEGLYHMGVVFQKMKNYEKAIDVYMEAIKLNPYYYDALANVAAVYISVGDEVEAEKALKQALEYNRYGKSAYIGLTNLYMSQKKYTEAKTILTKALFYFPEDGELIKLKDEIEK